MAMKEIPVLLLTGYLGSGKTTLLNRILSNRKGIKFAVIVNDIGEVNIDADLIQQGGIVDQKDDSLVALQNGCICCTLKMDLVEQLTDLVKMGQFDYIVIEASGICEPAPIAQTICSIPTMEPKYWMNGLARLDCIVTVVDALRMKDEFGSGTSLQKPNIAEEDIENLVIQQIEFCNIVLLNKAAEVEPQELARIKQIVRAIQPKADIIECNFSCPHMSGDGLGSDVGQNPELVKRYTELVSSATNVPVLAKMTPNIGNIELPAIAAAEGGASGIAAINTIKSILGIDTDTLVSYPSISGKCAVSGYSGKAVKPIALRFISDLAHCERLSEMELSGIGGIETWHDALEFILLGCKNIQITTAVMQYGYRIIEDLISGTKHYMSSHGIKCISQLVGAAVNNIIPADELDRRTIIYPAFDRKKCIGCGRCFISCSDGGHQAIEIKGGKAVLHASKCVGCHLCMLVCPVNAISDRNKRIPKR